MIDTHIHISHHMFNGEFPCLTAADGKPAMIRADRTQLIELFKKAGITTVIEPAISIDSNEKLLALARQYNGFVFPAVGVHPTRTCIYSCTGKDSKPERKKLKLKDRHTVAKYADDPSVIAVGETGLDYHLSRKEQHRIRQKFWFVWQIHLADKKKPPLILHIRQADKDAVKILKRHKRHIHGGVCHCFSGDAAAAEKYTSLGLMLGIGGALLMSSERQAGIEQAVINTPADMLLLETDGPYVKPDCPDLSNKQMKKVRNTSLILPLVAQRIAELNGMTAEEVIRITSENAVRLFGLEK